MTSTEKIKLLIVDDSTAYRNILKAIAGKDEEIEIIGLAENGRQALEIISQAKPDVVTLDIEMPEMDGIETMKKIREVDPEIQVLMLSSLTEYGGHQTIDALSFGAADFMPKSFIEGHFESNVQLIKKELLEKIKLLYKHKSFQKKIGESETQVITKVDSSILNQIPDDVNLIAIGVSAGGYNSILRILPKLDKDFSVPIIIVQHMPELYIKDFLAEIKKIGKIPVKPIQDNFPIFVKYIYIGSTDHLIEIEKHGRLNRLKVIDKAAASPERAKAPIDSFFKFLSEMEDFRVIGVLLKFSGGDGMEGLRVLKAKGFYTIIQDSEMLGLGETQFADIRAPIECIPSILNKAGVKKK
ncbi:MAG: response regulator [Candidatus Aureabacteria bacterium]|nr:response regulator [Candidatus Auribacterota bacterium]